MVVGKQGVGFLQQSYQKKKRGTFFFGLRPPMSGRAVPFRHGKKLLRLRRRGEAEPPIILGTLRKGKAFPLIGGRSPKKRSLHRRAQSEDRSLHRRA